MMQLTVEPLMFSAFSLFSTKCLCSQLTYILQAKISCGVQRAVTADLTRQVDLESINLLIRRESAF